MCAFLSDLICPGAVVEPHKDLAVGDAGAGSVPTRQASSFVYQSPYALSTDARLELAERQKLQKLREFSAMQKKQQEEEEKRQRADEAFQTWLKNKKQQQKLSIPSNPEVKPSKHDEVL